MYGSVPIEDTMFPGAVTVVSDFFEKHKHTTCLNLLTKDDFSHLLRLCLTSDTITAGGKVYKQKIGLQMGNNTSGACAVIFMDFIERQVLHQLSDNIITWIRYIDDIFTIYRNIASSELVKVCNEIHPNINFTAEEETTNGTIPFLDLLVMKQGDKLAHTLCQAESFQQRDPMDVTPPEEYDGEYSH